MPTQNKSPLPSFHLQIPTAPFPSPDTQILSFIWGPWCPVVVLFSPFASSLNYASYFECYVMLDKRWENHCKIFSLQIITQKWTHYLLQVKTHHVCLCSRCMRKMKSMCLFMVQRMDKEAGGPWEKFLWHVTVKAQSISMFGDIQLSTSVKYIVQHSQGTYLWSTLAHVQ